ncbi:hypothetical protein [Streptomyces mirabilis]|uniref:hypothetical protein n=1 Tax=Streptomyces mirabilis TaxID=68239 RepID=UPI00225A5710|nr:hypothetical protein [Streptomyces mirabilis]MCX4617946.1 hypothetical protein [Streptomyces mirabilis]
MPALPALGSEDLRVQRGRDLAVRQVVLVAELDVLQTAAGAFACTECGATVALGPLLARP